MNYGGTYWPYAYINGKKECGSSIPWLGAYMVRTHNSRFCCFTCQTHDQTLYELCKYEYDINYKTYFKFKHVHNTYNLCVTRGTIWLG